MIERFEDLVAWQKARELTRSVYAIAARGRLAGDFGLKRQMERSAVSIMANVAEGFERYGTAEFHHFLSIAKSSCAELRSHFYVALDVGYLDDATFQILMSQAAEVARIIGGLRASLQHRDE